jgi:hypothetical protein
LKLINRWILAREAVAEWQALAIRRPGAAPIAAALTALGPNPDPDAVDGIIYSRGWTRVPRCEECGDNPDEVIAMGPLDDNGELRSVYFCAKCLLTALQTIEP